MIHLKAKANKNSVDGGYSPLAAGRGVPLYWLSQSRRPPVPAGGWEVARGELRVDICERKRKLLVISAMGSQALDHAQAHRDTLGAAITVLTKSHPFPETF